MAERKDYASPWPELRRRPLFVDVSAHAVDLPKAPVDPKRELAKAEKSAEHLASPETKSKPAETKSKRGGARLGAGRKTEIGQPWVAAGISRAAWYRDGKRSKNNEG